MADIGKMLNIGADNRSTPSFCIAFIFAFGLELLCPNCLVSILPVTTEDLLYEISSSPHQEGSTFTFMHLADPFIQSDLLAIHFLSVCVFTGNRTHNLCAANAML